MKKIQKLLSIVLAIAILFTTTTFASVSYGASTDAYIENGKYYRLSNGEYIECYLDSNELAQVAQNRILSKSMNNELLHYYFASPDYVDMSNEEAITKMQNKIESNIRYAIFTLNDADPRLGQYFEKSGEIDCWANIYPADYDTPIDGVVYHTYGITLKANHSLTEAEERYISKFAEIFSESYIPEGADDYTKVKTIYDFVVRNTVYDHELFMDKGENGDLKFPHDSDRFRISHSAYGAIKGNLLQYDSANPSNLIDSSDINIKYNEYASTEQQNEYIDIQVEYDFKNYFGSKKTITNQKIVRLRSNDDGRVIQNGKAVCEGYSKLFYYLCVYNGIQTRIVDGDYVEYISSNPSEIKQLYGDLKSGKASDPHEWNYVYLDDNTGKGKQWYVVDSTWGAQKSIPTIDYNNYEYFLIGAKYSPDGLTINPAYSVENHPQPYVENGPIPQLYNWYVKENKISDIDYDVPPIDLGCLELNDDHTVIIERKTNYDGDVRYAYILQGKDNAVKITLDEDVKLTENIGGFDYNGKNNAEFRLIIPYLTGYEYQSPITTNIKDVGTYSVSSTGMIIDGVPTEFDVDFKITPVNMSKDSNYSVKKISNYSTYNGNEIIPKVEIVDGYYNNLTSNDYDIVIKQKGENAILKEMGVYDIRIEFKGNYYGVYDFQFTIGKIDLSQINLGERPLPYLPEYYRKDANVDCAADYFNAISTLKIGTQQLKNGVDFTVTSNGSIANFGDRGTLILSSKSDSLKCEANKQSIGSYVVSELFDISGEGDNGVNLNNQAADSNTVNHVFYDGTAKTPTKFDNLDQRLVRGKDYEIVGYSNNINAGEAYVTIKGIEKNGCTGTAKMKFAINPANITTADINAKLSNGNIVADVVWNGKTLVDEKDYTLEVQKQSETMYLLVVTGINNYAGKVNVQVQTQSQNPTIDDPTAKYVKPTASGNKLTLSKTTYVYSGSACKPTVKLVNKNGKTVNSYYYTVSYSNNKNVGTAKATIKFRNGYAGSMSITFAINPKATTLSSLTAASKGFTVKWKKQATQTTGYEIQIATNSKFTSGVKKYTVSKNSTTSYKAKSLKAKKKYYVRIRTYKTVSGKKYYSAWSGSKTVTTKK